jgi:hypothetical protein
MNPVKDEIAYWVRDCVLKEVVSQVASDDFTLSYHVIFDTDPACGRVWGQILDAFTDGTKP